MKLLLLTASVLLSGIGTSAAGGSDAPLPTNEAPQDDPVRIRPSEFVNNYCGVASLYCIARSFGAKIEFRDLLRPEFITSPEGSSAADLEAAAAEIGLHTSLIAGVTPEDLALIGTPAILHVSWEGDPATYNHWVAYLGEEHGRPLIVDVPNDAETYDPEELLARWDGLAICISSSPIPIGIFYGRRVAWVANVLLFLVALRFLGNRVAVRFASPHQRDRLRRLWQVFGILVLGTGTALAYHATSTRGFLQNPRAVQLVAEAYAPTFLEKLQVEELRSLLTAGSVVLIDARYEKDYLSAHLPGAINMPINANLGERRRMLEGVPQDARIVVYCQSAGCGFDERVASFLVAEGYRNVQLFPGGWNEWTSGENTEQ